MKHFLVLAAMSLAAPALAQVPAPQQPTPPEVTGPGMPSFAQPLKNVPKAPTRKLTPINDALRQSARDAIDKGFLSKNGFIRANAVEAAEHTFPAADARAMALKALSDTAPVVRFAGCVACGNLAYADTHDALYKLAYDSDPSVRLAARYGLHKLGNTSLTNEMLLGLTDEREGVRGNTVMLLGMLGEKSAIPLLRRKYTDGSTVVRLQVAEALWKLGDPDSRDHVIAGTVSPYGSEVVASLLALVATHDYRVGGSVYSFLRSESPEIAITAARCLGTLGSDEGLGVVYKYVDSGDSRQRSMCCQAFGEIARSDTQDALKKLMDDSAPDVRLAAATAVLKLKPPVTATANGQ